MKIRKVLLVLTLVSTSLQVSDATPPGPPKLFRKIQGQIIYAVWRDSHTVNEARLERDGDQATVFQLSKKATWYVALKDVEGINDFDRETISVALPMSPLYPKMPRFESLPKGSIIIEFEGGSNLPIALGRKIEIVNAQFSMDEYGVGSLTSEKVRVRE